MKKKLYIACTVEAPARGRDLFHAEGSTPLALWLANWACTDRYTDDLKNEAIV